MKRPEPFEDFGEELMSNFDHSIDRKVEEAIKGKPYYAQYSGWNFCGYVWWENEKWHCEVWTYGSMDDVISANTLDDIMTEVSDKYGYD